MRILLALATVCAFGTPALAQEAGSDFGPQKAAPAATSFSIGSVRATSLADGGFVAPNDAKVFGVDAGPEKVAEALKASGVASDRIRLSVNALLIRDGKRLILLDTGLGPASGYGLAASLKKANINPAAVTDVLITHSHFDHAGGLVSPDGKSAFPKATIRMAQAEWDFVKSQSQSAALVAAIGAQVKAFVPGERISPNVVSVDLPGHTPGHAGYRIGSGKTAVLDVGDMVHSSLISLAHPEWTMGFDSVPDTAKATRKAQLAALAKSGQRIFSVHFPYPGVGRIVAKGDGYTFVPGLK